MRPTAIVTAIVLLGVFASTTASQTSSLPRAPEPPNRLPANASANTPNILRHGETLRGNVSPRPDAHHKVESRQPESWHQPATTPNEPAPVKIVTGFPQAQPAAAAVVTVVTDQEQPQSARPPYAKGGPKKVFSAPYAKTEGRREAQLETEAQPGDLANYLSVGSKAAPPAVMPANYEAHPEKLVPPEKIAPPRKSRTADMKLGENRKQKKQDKNYEAPGGMSSLITIVGSLAVVIGLFLIVAFLMRRATPSANLPLPDEVVEILGRAPLANRQQVHLLRCGTKLLLVCVTPNGTETLTEITDPAEVDRVATLCRRNSTGSATANFRQVFEQLSWENGASKPTGGRS